MQASVMDQCVRLAFAIILIVLVSIGLYQFAGNADCYGFTPLTGRLKTVDPTTKNNVVSFTVRANMRPHPA